MQPARVVEHGRCGGASQLPRRLLLHTASVVLCPSPVQRCHVLLALTRAGWSCGVATVQVSSQRRADVKDALAELAAAGAPMRFTALAAPRSARRHGSRVVETLNLRRAAQMDGCCV
jgi:hypothetical protein